MADSSISQDYNSEDAMKAIPEAIHEELIDLLLKMPLETMETDDFASAINSVIEDSSVSPALQSVVQEGNFRFDQSFLDNLNFRGEKSELVANSLLGKCLCAGGVRRPCPCP